MGQEGCYIDTTVDHRKAPNPYLSRYGDQWREIIKGSIKGHVCVTDLIEHMMKESARIMKGTVYDDTWMLYHDALSLVNDISFKFILIFR